MSVNKILKLKGYLEVEIAELLEMNRGVLLIPLSIISIFVCLTIWKIIPNNKKKEFILSAIIGCPIGYVLWMLIIGPIVLP